MKKETNHDKFVRAFRGMEGKTLTTKKIEQIMLNKTDIKKGSIRPNDHAEGNACPCWCAKTDKRIFDRIKKGSFIVRKIKC